MDSFPEAFNRYEDVVETEDITTLPELIASFKSWAKKRAPMTRKQKRALAKEGQERLGIKGAEQQTIEYDITLKSGELRHIIRRQWRDLNSGQWTTRPEWA